MWKQVEPVMQMEEDKKRQRFFSYLLLEGFVSTRNFMWSCKYHKTTSKLMSSPTWSSRLALQLLPDISYAWKDKKPAEGGVASSQSERSIPSHDGVKEQALSSQQAFVHGSSPQLKAKCSICMAGKTKTTTTALRRTSHRGYGLAGLVSISILFKN